MKDLQSLYLVLTIEYTSGSGSSKRRKAEIGLVRPTREMDPEDDFGEVFFSKEWSDWTGFYHFILSV